MTAQVLSLSAAVPPRPYADHMSDASGLCSYCMMLLQQLDIVRTGHEIHITRRYSKVSIDLAQKELAEMHGYPTKFEEGGDHGFGYLLFL